VSQSLLDGDADGAELPDLFENVNDGGDGNEQVAKTTNYLFVTAAI
jgi:hypothetical protein